MKIEQYYITRTNGTQTRQTSTYWLPCTWNALSEAVYQSRRQNCTSVEGLKGTIVANGEGVYLHIVKHSITQWKKRLCVVVHVDGRAIAHEFK